MDDSNPILNSPHSQEQASGQEGVNQPNIQPETITEQKPNANQVQLNPELVAELVQNGLSEKQAQGVASYLAQGGSPEEVDEFLRSNK